jgi:hypothetical protein
VRAEREIDDGNFAAKIGDDLIRPTTGSFLKFRRGKMPAVAVENLHGVHARGDLHLQIRGDGGGQFFRERKIVFGSSRKNCSARLYFGTLAPSIMNVASVHGEPVKPSSAVWSPSSCAKFSARFINVI